MALQALPQAIQYDNTPNQMLARLADDLRQQRVYEQRLRDEDNARKFQLLQSISPEVLNEKFDKEVVNASIVGLRDNVSQFLAKNPNASSTALQEMIQKQLGSVAQWSNKAKMIRENIANTAKELKSTKGIDVAGLQAAAITRAFKNPDGSLKTPDQLNADIDWASDTYAQAPDKFIDIAEVGKGFEDRLNKAQKIDRNKTVQVIKDGKKVLDTLKYTINPWQDIDEQGNVVTKKTPEGYLVPEQFQALVPAGSVDDVYWTRLAKNRMAEHNAKVASGDKEALKIGAISLDDPGNLMQVKWALVTNYLDQKSGSKVSDINKQEPIKVSVNVDTKDKKTPIEGWRPLALKVSDPLKSGLKTTVVTDWNGKQADNAIPLTELSSTEAELLQKMSNIRDANGDLVKDSELYAFPSVDAKGNVIGISVWHPGNKVKKRIFSTEYNRELNNKFGNQYEYNAARQDEQSVPLGVTPGQPLKKSAQPTKTNKKTGAAGL